MKNTFGYSVKVTIFGESHGGAIGAVIDGLAPGIPVDEEFIARMLSKRRPSGAISTARREKDKFVIESGVFEGKTCGTPICILIPNEENNSRDYAATRCLARPGHADFTANEKYHGFEDYRGGGHFSGRITAALVAAGAIMLGALKAKGIRIGTHIKKCAGVCDRDFDDIDGDIELLSGKSFAVLDPLCEEKMRAEIERAASELDSVGGVLESVVTGLPAGLGEPWFDSMESMMSHMLFSIPAVKGVEFGDGFAMADMRGSVANDPFAMKDGKVVTLKNSNGGINGGITNGMPVVFRCAVKPTPSIFRAQDTVDFVRREDAKIEIKGRHDPCIVHRAASVTDCAAAIVLCDALAMRYGTDFLAPDLND